GRKLSVTQAVQAVQLGAEAASAGHVGAGQLIAHGGRTAVDGGALFVRQFGAQVGSVAQQVLQLAGSAVGQEAGADAGDDAAETGLRHGLSSFLGLLWRAARIAAVFGGLVWSAAILCRFCLAVLLLLVWVLV